MEADLALRGRPPAPQVIGPCGDPYRPWFRFHERTWLLLSFGYREGARDAPAGAALHRIGMADQRQATGLGQVKVKRLDLAAGAIEQERDFAAQQGKLRDPVTGRLVLD